MDHHVGAEREQRRGGEGVVDHEQGVVRVGQLDHRFDVDDAQPGVGGRLDPDHAGAVGPRVADGVGVRQTDGAHVESGGCVDLASQAMRAAVGVVGQEQPVAGAEQAEQRVFGG